MMANNQERINQLQEKLELLLKRQNDFSKEINNLRIEIFKMRSENTNDLTQKEEIKQVQPIAPTVSETKKEDVSPVQRTQQQQPISDLQKQTLPNVNAPLGTKTSIERFIGENLINKIGIAITVIGIAIGAKYSIEHDLISPLPRIILGYLSGIVLLGFGIKLKAKYENYSAVLVSGAIAIMYFITYAAYGFYDLFPQILAFILMVILTGFTIVAATKYNNQVIAHIGMVGAYAVPFLLGDGTGEVSVLFAYMAIINIGILIISIKRYWKVLYYSTMGLTWIIFASWYAIKYNPQEQFILAFTFLSIFFVIFYLTFITYKLLNKEKFEIGDILLLLFNSFIFYGLGYSMLNSQHSGTQFLGLFTLCNALVHFFVSALFYKQKRADRKLFYLSSGLVLVFITIAIPVQLDGNWVTLLWVSEATLLFWLGRAKNIPIYENLSYPLMVLAFISIIQDWEVAYNVYTPKIAETRITPLLNINFLSSMLFIVGFGLISYINHFKKSVSSLQKETLQILSFSIPAILLIVIYSAFRIEITTYWNQLFTDSTYTINTAGQEYPSYYYNYDLNKLKTIWVINYSLLFFSILAFVNIKKIKNELLGMINLGLIAIALFLFLTQGLYVLSELRESYLSQDLSKYYHIGIFNVGIRYISYTFVLLTLVVTYKYLQQEFMKIKLNKAFDLLLHISVLWIISSELINLLELSESAQSYKLGLSILWGVYSLFLIVLGIWKKKKHLRIGAIILFGITLLKLFFYDIANLNTIAKTIVFVSLGVLLLIISFLYNKYKHIISNETNN